MEAHGIQHYLELFDTLRRRHRWQANTDVLRFAALTLASVDLSDPVERLEVTAKALKDTAKGTSALRSLLRYSIAAMIVRRGLDPAVVVARINEVRREFRARRIRRGGTHEMLAVLLLVLHAGGGEVPGHTVRRLEAILKRWKQDHPWLTGPGDYPMAALHATRGMPVEQIGRHVEEIYQALRAKKYSRGNQLQLAAHLLAVSKQYPMDSAVRFAAIADALRGRKVRFGPSQYDEVALLSLTELDPGTLARRFVAVQQELLRARPRPVKTIAFSLAAGLLLSEEARARGGLGEAGDLATIQAAQEVLEAQQAAMTAAIAAATTSTATS